MSPVILNGVLKNYCHILRKQSIMWQMLESNLIQVNEQWQIKLKSSVLTDFCCPEYHGHGGEMEIQIPPWRGMADLFVQATQESGYTKTDLNAPFGAEGKS
jgi:hypothetical protein